MPTTTETDAIEKSTYIVTAAFTDSDGNAITPVTITWTLTDSIGNVINNREDISLTPGTSVDIVLSENDLAIGTNGIERILMIEGTYSSAYGTNLPFKDILKFNITDLAAISN